MLFKRFRRTSHTRTYSSVPLSKCKKRLPCGARTWRIWCDFNLRSFGRKDGRRDNAKDKFLCSAYKEVWFETRRPCVTWHARATPDPKVSALYVVSRALSRFTCFDLLNSGDLHPFENAKSRTVLNEKRSILFLNRYWRIRVFRPWRSLWGKVKSVLK